MNLPPLEFRRTFSKLAESAVSAGSTDSLTNSGPMERVEFDPATAVEPKPQGGQLKTLSREAHREARQLALSLNPTATVNLAVLAAMKVTSTPAESEDAEVFAELIGDSRGVDTHPWTKEAWTKLQPHLAMPLDAPLLTDSHRVRGGTHTGRQVYLNPEGFKDPHETLFVMAHEYAHAELRHGVRRAALRNTEALFGIITPKQSEALEEVRWDLEFQADSRAVELTAKTGIDPLPVLETLLQSGADRDHPGGLARATAVRNEFAKHGIQVSEQDWNRLMDETAQTRAYHEERELKEREFRESLKDFT